MTDRIVPNTIGLGNYPRRIVESGDGTWAEKVLAMVAVGGAQVSASNPLPVTITSGSVSLADQSVVDGAGTFWLVRDSGTMLSYVNWATGLGGTPVAPVAPAGKLAGQQIISTQYNATAAGTGYATGDVLSHIVILNIATTPATVVANTWANISQGTVLSTIPAPVSLAELTATVGVTSLPALPAGANLIGAVNLDIGGVAISANNPMPMLDAFAAPASASWTTTTPVNTAAAFGTGGYDTVIVTVAANSTFSGGAVVFEVYDGGNWMPVKAANIANYTTTGNTITPVANATSGYQIPVAGFPQFRVRLASVPTAGAVLVTTIVSSVPDVSVVTAGLDPSQPLPAGTNTLGSVIIDNVTDSVTVGPVTVTAATTVVMANTTGFGGGSFNIQSVGTGNTIVFEQSDDQITWFSLFAWAATGSGNNQTAQASAIANYAYNATMQYVRARVSVYSSGNVTVAIRQKRIGQFVPAFLQSGPNLVGDLGVQYRPNATGAALASSILSPAIPTGGVIKPAAGRIVGWTLTNSAASLRSVKFFSASAVAVGTTPAAFEIDIPAGATAALAPVGGIGFASGIMWAVTAAKGLVDATATGLAANDVSGVVLYA